MPKMQQPKVAPPSAPMMTNYGPEPDDIPDTFPVPPGLADEAMDAHVPGLPVEAPRIAQEPPSGTAPTVAPSQVSPPPGAFLPLAHGFCQYLQSQVHTFLGEEHRQLQASVDVSLAAVRHWAEGMLQGNEHAQYTLGDALLKIQAGGVTQTTGTPYTAVIDARTPHGYPLRLTIEKGTSSELIEELGRLEGWLVANGYCVVEGAAT